MAKASKASDAKGKTSAKGQESTGGYFALPKTLKLAGHDDFVPLLGKTMRVKGTDFALILDRITVYQPRAVPVEGVRPQHFSLVFKDRKVVHALQSGLYEGEFDGGPSQWIHVTALPAHTTFHQEYEAVFG